MIADYKNPENTVPPITAWRYLADVKNISNMYPYGKSYGTNATYDRTDDYRYGFNGMEKEKNMDASGDITDFGARVYDSGLPTFLSRDPLETKFAYLSPYSQFDNNPIKYMDEDGNASKTKIQGNNIYYTTKIHMFGDGASLEEVNRANKEFKDLYIRVPGDLKNNYFEGKGHLKVVTDKDGKDWNIYLNVEFVYTPELDNEFKNIEDLKKSNLELPEYIPEGENIQMVINSKPIELHGQAQKGGNKSYVYGQNYRKNASTHESLHNMGFGDRLTLLYGNNDAPPIATEIEGFEGDIMMLGGGIINNIHFENILEFVKQNLPETGSTKVNDQPKIDDAEPKVIK